MADLYDDDESPKENSEWLGTFADISLLLLVFFILLVSMSTIETIKFESIFGSMRDAFGGLPIAQDSEGGQLVSADSDKEAQAIRDFVRIREELLEAQRMAYNQIHSYITTKGVEGHVSAVFDSGIITLSLPDGILFGPGSETLLPSADGVLNVLLEIFQTQREESINIKGYTDNSPIPSEARYRDNWELSALRAVNVLRWFVDAGVPIVRLTATGMGDLNPLFPNDTPENRARNRRVEIVLERKVGGEL